MKAIISHDVDHLTLSEHYLNDLIVPKFFARSYIELITGKIDFSELYNRYTDVFKNKWQHLKELHEFNTQHGVPATFFIAINKGVGLNYSLEQATIWINEIKTWDCEIGIHGIEFENFEKVNAEYNTFKSITNQKEIGTRMHYIRTNNETFNNMDKAGYLFDSSEMAFKAPYKIGNMWEFPFQIMDGYIIEKPKPWQCKNLQQCCDETKIIIEKAESLNLPYLGIDFHDRYFSNSHKTWKNWYIWLVNYLMENKIECVNFKQAIAELESKSQ